MNTLNLAVAIFTLRYIYIYEKFLNVVCRLHLTFAMILIAESCCCLIDDNVEDNEAMQ